MSDDFDRESAVEHERRVTGNALVTEQAAPIPNDKPAVWDLVMADMQARDAEGRRKYGTPLQPRNGRDALVDAYQEGLDLVVYLRQAIWERDHERERQRVELNRLTAADGLAKLHEELVAVANDRDEWKRRAVAHGCDADAGDPDCA